MSDKEYKDEIKKAFNLVVGELMKDEDTLLFSKQRLLDFAIQVFQKLNPVIISEKPLVWFDEKSQAVFWDEDAANSWLKINNTSLTPLHKIIHKVEEGF